MNVFLSSCTYSKHIKYYVFIVFCFSWLDSYSQRLPLFNNKERIALVKKGGNYIYNMQPDSAKIIIEQVKVILPNHPVVPMMEALNIAWTEMPIYSSSKIFNSHISALDRVIELSENLQDKVNNHPEGVFFEMSARGLKAEYYAKEGSYMKSLSEARKMYSLLKQGFDLVDKYPEFLFPIGLYNYFREKYPERHPIYKPFLWVFKSGDIEKGLLQLDNATKVGVLTKIEANLYISYIYLRYEKNTSVAKKYLISLVDEYPNNTYFKSKLIEYFMLKKNYDKALPLINSLKNNTDDYYKMCNYVFYGTYLEKSQLEMKNAQLYYEKTLELGNQYALKASYFKSLANIGLGRVHALRGIKTLAFEYFEKAIEIDDNDLIIKEAEEGILKLDL